ATGKAATRAALPKLRIRLLHYLALAVDPLHLAFLELRWALGDQCVELADEDSVLHLSGEDDLASTAERIGNRALVNHRQRRRTIAVGHFESDPVALLADRADDDPPGHHVALAGYGFAEELGRLLGLRRRGERGVDQGDAQQNRRRQGQNESAFALSSG